jgi:hypothetical protein
MHSYIQQQIYILTWLVHELYAYYDSTTLLFYIE